MKVPAFHGGRRCQLFRPSPERRDAGREGRFLVRDAESLIRQPQVAPVPTIAGLSGNEGIYAFYYLGEDLRLKTKCAK